MIAQDARRIEATLAPHRGWVTRMAYGIMGNREDAEDVCQLVFLKLWRFWPNMRAECVLPRVLKITTRHICIDKLRRRKPANLREEWAHGVGDPRPGPEAATLLLLCRTDAVAAVRAVDGDRGEAFERMVDGETYEEIARAMGIPVGTVKSRLHRARRILRERGTL